MTKASRLSKELEKLSVTEGMELIDKANKESTYFDVINNTMCIMHDDGSVNIIESMGSGVITCEVITPDNVLKVLNYYRPFKEVFKSGVQ